MSLRLVPPLPPGTPGDPGLTGPGSVTWHVCRERVVPLGGLSALLLQLAHPLVAAGVARSVVRIILRARLRGIPVAPWSYLLAVGLLPAPLRAQYGLRWSAPQRALWWLFTHAVHVVIGRLAPGRIRFWSHYHAAMARCPGAPLCQPRRS
jgi:uncharacterized protein (DUF2236 family)